jgi:hypothetical protein
MLAPVQSWTCQTLSGTRGMIFLKGRLPWLVCACCTALLESLTMAQCSGNAFRECSALFLMRCSPCEHRDTGWIVLHVLAI